MLPASARGRSLIGCRRLSECLNHLSSEVTGRHRSSDAGRKGAYPDMARWQDEYARASREQGYTQTVAGRRWHWKWQAQNPDDLDEDAPFYADRLVGFRGTYAVNELFPARAPRSRWLRHWLPVGFFASFSYQNSCQFPLVFLALSDLSCIRNLAVIEANSTEPPKRVASCQPIVLVL